MVLVDTRISARGILAHALALCYVSTVACNPIQDRLCMRALMGQPGWLDPSAYMHGSLSAGIRSRVTRPQQSWQCSGLHCVQVEQRRPVAVAAYLKGVTRRDDLDTFCLQDMIRRSGQGCILVDRLIHEIAYKVARALKFGS